MAFPVFLERDKNRDASLSESPYGWNAGDGGYPGSRIPRGQGLIVTEDVGDERSASHRRTMGYPIDGHGRGLGRYQIFAGVPSS